MVELTIYEPQNFEQGITNEEVELGSLLCVGRFAVSYFDIGHSLFDILRLETKSGYSQDPGQPYLAAPTLGLRTLVFPLGESLEILLDQQFVLG